MSRTKIINAAIKLFSQFGYYRASMEDIAHEANVAKGTLYYHFVSKSELFETIVTDGFQLLMKEVQSELLTDEPADKQIRSIVLKHVELFLNYSELIHILSNEISNGIEQATLQRILAQKQQYLDFLTGVMVKGHQEGYIQLLNFELAAAAMLGLIEKVCIYYHNNSDRLNITELHETINAFVLHTLLTKFQPEPV